MSFPASGRRSREHRSLPRRRRWLVLLTAALAGWALLALPASASPAGEIVIHGSSRESHVRLSMSGDEIVVSGVDGRRDQGGCDFSGGMRCPLEGVDRIEVEMGPADNKVEVLKPLPVPLTVHLGGGSSKFIGNNEPDTCYAEGSKANGCFGRGGEDRCIVTGGNSECYGGPGNDFCKGGPGSDGCWGGPGKDVCFMGAGEDACHGGPGNDRLFGGPGADQLYGGPGFDYCDGEAGVGGSHGCEAGPGR